MWDPKKLREDRTPPPARPAPRGTSIDDTTITLRDGHCVQCRKPYSMGEQIGRNLAASHSSFSTDPDGYCLDCWRSIHGAN
jgi:hypothetical protein